MIKPENPTLVVASRNRGKISEYQRMLGQLGVRVVSMDQAGVGPEVELPEDGTTFEANALQKASALHGIIGGWTLGDDSGLEVDALGGSPGVYSARYAGSSETGRQKDKANYRKLLEELRGVAGRERTARFVCAIAVLGPEGRCVTARGTCEGRIADAPRGQAGFGYDPVFVPQGRDCTMAELSMDQKNSISHRGRAMRLLVRRLGEELKK